MVGVLIFTGLASFGIAYSLFRRLGIHQGPALFASLAFALAPYRIFSNDTLPLTFAWALAPPIIAHAGASLFFEVERSLQAKLIRPRPQLTSKLGVGLLLLGAILFPSVSNLTILLLASALWTYFPRHSDLASAQGESRAHLRSLVGWILILGILVLRSLAITASAFPRATAMHGSYLKLLHTLMPHPHHFYQWLVDWRIAQLDIVESFAPSTLFSRYGSFGFLGGLGLLVFFWNCLHPSKEKNPWTCSALTILILGSIGGIPTWVPASLGWIHLIALYSLAEWLTKLTKETNHVQ